MYAIVDVETTGGQFGKDRITEIAIYIYDGKKIVNSFTTLLNPQRKIDPYVVKLTGISDEMVADAPTFKQKAQEIFDILQGNFFVAHNVRFDYGVIRSEFLRINIDYKAPLIDTVSLSRKAFPGFSSYSLGKICEQLGITIADRHRAHGDAFATVALFEKILAHPQSNELIEQEINQGLNIKHLPPAIKKETIMLLPDSAGVLFFADIDGKLLYIEPSKNLQRAAIHFFNKYHSDLLRKEWFSTIADLSYLITGNEIFAKIKAHQITYQQNPLYNKPSKYASPNFAVVLEQQNGQTIHQFKVLKNSEVPDSLPALRFSSRSLAQKAMRKLYADSQLTLFQQLMAKITDKEKWLEQAALLNSKMVKSIQQYYYKHNNFLIVANGVNPDQKAVIWIANNEYRGSAYIDKNILLNNTNIAEYITFENDDATIHKIIRTGLRKDKHLKIINLG